MCVGSFAVWCVPFRACRFVVFDGKNKEKENDKKNKTNKNKKSEKEGEEGIH